MKIVFYLWQIFLFVCPTAGSWQGEQQWHVGTWETGDGWWAPRPAKMALVAAPRPSAPKAKVGVEGEEGTALIMCPALDWLSYKSPGWGGGGGGYPHRLVRSSNLRAEPGDEVLRKQQRFIKALVIVSVYRFFSGELRSKVKIKNMKVNKFLENNFYVNWK